MKYHPYKMRKAQKLHPGDPEKRKTFCELLTALMQQNQRFYRDVLWTDEKPFQVNGCFNRQIYR